MLRGAVLGVVLALTCVGCSDDATTPEPTPSTSSDGASDSASTSPSSSPSPTPTKTAPSKFDGYTDAEVAAYREAVRRYGKILERNDSFYAAGKTSKSARDFYQKYSTDWSTVWGNLAEAVNNGVRVRGDTEIVWTKPVSVELDGESGDVVVIRGCFDQSDRVVTQSGERLDQPQLEEPRLFRIRLERRPGESWWRSGIAKQGAPC